MSWLIIPEISPVIVWPEIVGKLTNSVYDVIAVILAVLLITSTDLPLTVIASIILTSASASIPSSLSL